VDIIRTAYYIRGLELIKLIFAVLDVSLTMGLTRCYKTEGFLHLLPYHGVIDLHKKVR